MNNARTHSAVQATVPLPGWGNAASDRLSYDGVGRMITKRYLTGGINGTTGAYNNTTALVGYTSSFDRASNKLYERHLEGDESRSHLYQPFNSDGSFAVGYDSANRLRQYQRGVLSTATIPYLVNPGASISTPITLPGTDQARTYGLDGLGNWKSTHFTEVGSGGSTTSTAETRAHNYVNEITAVKDITGSTTTSTPFAYDKNGNLLNDGVRSYQWDALNRLVQVNRMSDGAVIGAYTYDALNRRIQKTISNGGLTDDVTNGSSTYLYDNQQVAMQRDGSGNWLQAYFWGRYIDELLFLTAPTETVPTTYRVLSDLLYRSTALVDTGNNIVEAYDCDAYGNTLCFSGPGADSQWFTNDDIRTNNPINTTTFTGRLYDPESQIYYYRARYYSPHIGRFINRDPLENAELTQGPNFYLYVQGSPTNKKDPSGLSCLRGQVAASPQPSHPKFINPITGTTSQQLGSALEHDSQEIKGDVAGAFNWAINSTNNAIDNAINQALSPLAPILPLLPPPPPGSNGLAPIPTLPIPPNPIPTLEFDNICQDPKYPRLVSAVSSLNLGVNLAGNNAVIYIHSMGHLNRYTGAFDPTYVQTLTSSTLNACCACASAQNST